MFYFGTNTKQQLNQEQHEEVVEMAALLAKSNKDTQFFVLPTMPLLVPLKKMSFGSGLWVGSQRVSGNDGNTTGEISAKLIKELDADLVMVGHAERRRARWRRRALADSALLAHGPARQAHRRSGHAGRHLAGPGGRACDRRRDAVILPGARTRVIGPARSLRSGLHLRLYRHHVLARPVDTADDGVQPEGSLRAPVRDQRQYRPENARRRPPERQEPARLRCVGHGQAEEAGRSRRSGQVG